MDAVSYEFTVPGVPHAWQRPGQTREGRRFDTPGNKAAKGAIRTMARAAGVRPMAGGVDLWITFIFPRPKSHRKKDGGVRASAPRLHLSKPDTDNLVKTVKDALSGIAYEDDCEVCGLHVRKIWGDGDEACSVILIEPAEED